MRRPMTVALIAVGFAGLSVVPAPAAEYKGHIKGQPGSTVQLTFHKVAGKRKLTDSYTTGEFMCENGPSLFGFQLTWDPPVKVRHRSFNALTGSGENRSERRRGGDTLRYRLSGHLKRDGRASGTLRNRQDAGPPKGICDSGKLKWVAHKT